VQAHTFDVLKDHPRLLRAVATVMKPGAAVFFLHQPPGFRAPAGEPADRRSGRNHPADNSGRLRSEKPAAHPPLLADEGEGRWTGAGIMGAEWVPD